MVEKAENMGASVDELKQILGKGRAKKGIFEGDLAEGELEIGQITSLFQDIPTVQEVMKNLVQEFNITIKTLSSFQM